MTDAMIFKLEGAHGFGNPKMAGMGYIHIPVSGKGEIHFSEESNTPKKLGVPCIELTGLEVEDRGSVSTYVAGQKAGGVKNTAAGAVVTLCWPAQWELQSVLWPVLIAEARLGIRKAPIEGGNWAYFYGTARLDCIGAPATI